MQTARSTRRPERRPVKARQACRFCWTVGCLKSAQLDRLVGVKASRGSGAPGRHQRRSIVSGIFLKLNSAVNVKAMLAALDKRNGEGTARRIFEEVCDAVGYEFR